MQVAIDKREQEPEQEDNFNEAPFHGNFLCPVETLCFSICTLIVPRQGMILALRFRP